MIKRTPVPSRRSQKIPRGRDFISGISPSGNIWKDSLVDDAKIGVFSPKKVCGKYGKTNALIFKRSKNQHGTCYERGAKSMAGSRKKSDQPCVRPQAPAIGPANREQQLIGMAMDRAEQKFRDGTASDSLTIHFLRLATTKAELEKKKIEKEILKMNAQTNAIESTARVEELMVNAMEAMKRYGGGINRDDDEDLEA